MQNVKPPEIFLASTFMMRGSTRLQLSFKKPSSNLVLYLCVFFLLRKLETMVCVWVGGVGTDGEKEMDILK